MKKIFVIIFLLIFNLCLVGCVDTTNGPNTKDPYGEYDNTLLYSQYPMYATNEIINGKSKFTFTYAFKDGITSCVIDLEDIVSDYTLQELFQAPVDDEVLKEKYVALFFVRQEGFLNERLRDVIYSEFKIKDGEIFVSITYKDYITEGDTTMMYIEELILIPKEWTTALNQTSNFEVNYEVTNNTKLFYSLQEAFDNGFLVRDDLKKIANLKNNGVFNPIELEQEIATLIIKDFCNLHNVDYDENIGSVRCFGEYNGYYAIMVDGCEMMYLMMLTSENVDGITFYYSTSQHILIWKNNE